MILTKIEQIVMNFGIRFNPDDSGNLLNRMKVRRIQEGW